MTSALIIPGTPPQAVTGLDDPMTVAAPGPAVLFDDRIPAGRLDPHAGRPSGSAADPEATAPEATAPAPTVSVPERPLAYREAGRDWHVIGYEAADHWENLSPALRTRLLADRTAPLDVDEFKAMTNGASASMITNNWVRSGHPRQYRIAGELRDLAEVLARIADT
ncbi:MULTISPECIES: hypothetical protein [unclassified Brevibacterium]|uniref:hypothetical protein n=1 Tax=unclassified Brevibacterium TaxID=2614124 RepID=UPI0010F908DB|nr:MULTISPECIES: hypothetical protein [unclassified Brevibacterium]MCM1013942.1 hypothetical protein [Brevibacterium sp. XM4083]